MEEIHDKEEMQEQEEELAEEELVGELYCYLCSYKWTARISSPKTCPRCKRYDWAKEPEITVVKAREVKS